MQTTNKCSKVILFLLINKVKMYNIIQSHMNSNYVVPHILKRVWA